ncbi:Putative MIT domain superfamily protein [Septoria linicola]|uniref:MIT domain superfamily protein n=1 Tax=Septoria linicola TaxID=215465 RepID=A0A9Q9AT04_9PEZI|nr:putative MIT domain superfamily protein [Septoria linicola]USW55267.1 Putative MIT domain superfamily protein [Septoria linicola]
MFDLTLTQQVPAATLAAASWVQSTKQLIAIISNAFQLEEAGRYDDAIKGHTTASNMLSAVAKVKGIRKFNRRMYERQADIHQERIVHLESVIKTNGKAMLVPNRSCANTSPAQLGTLATNGPLSSTSAGAEHYLITTSSDLVDLGVRSHWFYLNKPAASGAELLTHYVMQCIWDNEKPTIESLLRRPDELFPLGGSLHTVILLQPELRKFKLRMRRVGEDENEAVWENPTKDAKKKDWSPRTFAFGERSFVWKNEDGKDSGMISRKWAFETLYETDGNEGAVVGERLAWGKIGGVRKGVKWTISIKEGLGVELKEHIIASQVSRLMRWSFPPQKDLSGVEAGALALGGAGTLISLASLLG